LREKPKQKNNPLVIFLKTGFCFLQEKQKKKHSKLFLWNRAILPFSELHNAMAFKIEGKEMYPIFAFAKCCLSVHSKW